MSQSSGLLSEDEVRSYLNEVLGLKLDRESLLRPNKDVICEVYTRLLDDIGCEWRRPRKSASESEDPNLKAMLAGWIRYLVDRYNIGYTFHLGDLISPTRKRTTAFLNVLVYIREQVQEQCTLFRQLKDEWDAKKAEEAALVQELSQRRIERDRLAIRKATESNVVDLEKVNKERKLVFDKLKKEGELLAEEARQTKTDIKAQAADNEQKKQQCESLDKDIIDLENNLHLLNEGRNMRKRKSDLEQFIQRENEQTQSMQENIQKTKEKTTERKRLISLIQLNDDELAKEVDYANNIVMKEKEATKSLQGKLENAKAAQIRWTAEEADLRSQLSCAERMRSKKKLQCNIEEERKKLELQEKKDRNTESAQLWAKRIEDLKQEIEARKREREKLSNQQSTKSELCKMYIEKANRQMELLIKLFESSKASTNEGFESLINFQRQYDKMFDRKNETEVAPQANQTYIKESGAPDKTRLMSQ